MDFELARFNMVEQQIRPWDVLDQSVLDLLFSIKREDFVPPAFRALAFSDLELPLDVAGARTGEVMLAPKVEARLLQAAAVRPSDSVLEIGAGSGYMAALLAQGAARVLSYEIQPILARFAAQNLQRAGIGNVVIREGQGLSAADAGPFDLIVLSGSVAFVPDQLMSALSLGGRLLAIVGDLPMMTAQIITRTNIEQFSAEILFDTVAKPLVGFPQKDRFVF
jgi:protein-L-isoaspartate(D-aspartate) O-methyltransferase